jgi:hypothetical protein
MISLLGDVLLKRVFCRHINANFEAMMALFQIHIYNPDTVGSLSDGNVIFFQLSYSYLF